MFLKKSYVYTFALADKFELPMVVSDTLDEMSRLTGFKKTALCMALERRSVIAGSFVIRRVNIKDLEFNFGDYNEFCNTEGIKPGHAKSLESFKQYCGVRYDNEL